MAAPEVERDGQQEQEQQHGYGSGYCSSEKDDSGCWQ